MPRSRIILLALLACLAFQTFSPAQQPTDQWVDLESGTSVIVTLHTGERYTGTFVEATDSHLFVKIGNVQTRLNRLDIRLVVTLRPAIDRYHEMRALIDDEDVDRLLILVDWLRAEKLFAQALEEIAIVLIAEPGNAQALRLQSLTRQQQTLALEQHERQTPGQTTARPARAPVPANRPAPGLFPILSEQDANLVKVYEIDLHDPPKILIDHETRQELINQYGGIANIPSNEALAGNFFKQEPADILNAMFEARARDLYTQVRVLELPDSLKQFRDNVNSTWLVNTCGTTTCHGGLNAGEFLLFSRAQNNERSAITNLLILERFRTSDDAQLLNYDFPENALLLQYALPINRASNPHPQVRGFRPAFRSTKSRRYVQAIQWMRSMHQPRPAYPVEYTPPRPADFEPAPSIQRAPAGEPTDR